MLRYLYNSRLSEYKKPFGAVKNGQNIEITIKAVDGVFVEKIQFVLQKDSCEAEYLDMQYLGKDINEDNISIFYLNFKIEKPGLYFYNFIAKTEFGLDIINANSDGWCSTDSEQLYQITCFDKSYKTPNFIKGGVIYHIFIDRFFRNEDDKKTFNKNGAYLKKWDQDVTVYDADGIRRANDFFGGNIIGLVNKLDYLQQLGVDMIYLSPIFQSPSNHRYDTSDYLKIDEVLGDERDFNELIIRTKLRNMNIMLDGVFNHTGADSIYFNKFNNFNVIGAYQSTESKYFSWYDFNNFPDEYRCWWGVTICPSVNQDNEEYIKFITSKNGVINKWNGFGIGAWRLDVVDELKPHFVKEIRKAVKKNDPNRLLIGEVWEDASNKISYSNRREYFNGFELDGVMNYVFKDAILDYVWDNNADKFKNRIMAIVENYPKQSLDVSMTLIGTHDTCRALTYFAGLDASNWSIDDKLKFRLSSNDYNLAIKRMKLAVILQFTLPGVPSIYYGDERGMEGFEDPINRRTINWTNYDEDLFNHYVRLAKLRKNYRSVFKGNFHFIDHPNLLIYKRSSSRSKSILFIINTNDTPIDITNLNCKQIVFGNIHEKNNGKYINAHSVIIASIYNTNNK